MSRNELQRPTSETDVGQVGRTWDIARDRFPLKLPLPLGSLEAPTYAEARAEAEKRWGKPVLVLAKKSSANHGQAG